MHKTLVSMHPTILHKSQCTYNSMHTAQLNALAIAPLQLNYCSSCCFIFFAPPDSLGTPESNCHCSSFSYRIKELKSWINDIATLKVGFKHLENYSENCGRVNAKKDFGWSKCHRIISSQLLQFDLELKSQGVEWIVLPLVDFSWKVSRQFVAGCRLKEIMVVVG